MSTLAKLNSSMQCLEQHSCNRLPGLQVISDLNRHQMTLKSMHVSIQSTMQLFLIKPILWIVKRIQKVDLWTGFTPSWIHVWTMMVVVALTIQLSIHCFCLVSNRAQYSATVFYPVGDNDVNFQCFQALMLLCISTYFCNQFLLQVAACTRGQLFFT